MTAKSVMVLGTTSGAGKSWLTTALCRYYARQGLKVAPFKAQNMSNNARVVAQGEIGSAQYFQSLAANAVPDVRMNPLLLKPEKDTQSQVVLMGQVNPELSRMEWRGRSASVWPVVARALDELLQENDVVVMEGAGSPAEINLKASDIVNMRSAQHANAACLLVTDIDRGGAFAHLYGTWAMLDEAERKLLKGFVLNKFRGDAKLLAPGPLMLQDMTGIPTVATLPMWWQHGLPEEDGVFDDRSVASGAVNRTVAVIAYPRISNLDEFQPLKNVPGVRLKWVRSPADLMGADWVILPGSKHTSGDLAWLRAQGLDQAVAAHAGRGGAVLGICGGLQMLGEALIDPHGIDGNAPGLGLLPVVTVFDEAKTVQHRQAAFTPLHGLWAGLSGVEVQGYEIHHGQTAPHSAMAAAGDVAHAVMPEGLAWQNQAGNVLGLYLHGMFEDPRVLKALFGAAVPTLDSVFDGLADYIGEHFDAGFLQSLIGVRQGIR
ncbi:adenosylcobyric acid synthase (glutamine-hydrolysing) [Polaromonas sp. YR568]|uniref:cobyric acid synthase n=1 Tax=Polaromonas sp. YR568 TaxID=1855301 RepID=UPI0008EC28B4|nr:cobyric acid synthase [Polaromonas sp. YR568]SFU52199.1 adenosylcobyric acid synthase (glutamine-hydrolysing) [Polaromonas sp. YR568]